MSSGPGVRPTEPAVRRPDASMSLLTEVMEHPLDPGYAAAAERRLTNGESPPRGLRAAVTVTVVVLLGMLLAAAALQTRGSSTARGAERAQLVDEITRQDAAVATLQKGNAALAATIESDRGRRLDQQSQGVLADKVNRLGLLTGALAVTGPGVRLTVQDAEAVAAGPGDDARANPTDEDGRVLDQDLQSAVNGLWAAGAEAVSINGQRLTALSAIRSAGQAILVDYRPLAPPYRILAIGDPNRLPARFGDTSGGRDLKYLADNFGLRYRLVAVRSLDLPANSGLDVRRAKPITGTNAPTTSDSPTSTTAQEQP